LSIEKAFEILETSKDASDKDIKLQYRLLVKKYHPDIVTGQGANQSTIKEATLKLQSINEAYDLIKKQRAK
jgi:DnaJ like chaperone protein